MSGLFSCCKGKHKELKVTNPIYYNNDLTSVDNNGVISVPEVLAEEYNGHLKSYHSDDLSEDSIIREEEDNAMRGVSNVVYRKEYVQSVYSFTSEQLGVGATGPIRTVINRETKTKFAMKTINLLGLKDFQKERLIQEVLILGRLHHPNIVKLYEVYETENAIYLIMELLSGGELYTRLIHSPQGKFSEEYARGIIRDVLNAIAYLHETKNIAHRDLKLANIMFADESPDSQIKLIDFGLSKIITNTDYMHSLVGTRYYMAPEVFSSNAEDSGYSKSCDMWSLGVITYFLLTGHNPLPPQMADQPLNQVQITHSPFPTKYWGELTPESKDFVQQLLQIDPTKRLTAIQAQNHPWFNSLTVVHPTSIPPEIVTAMQEFQGYNHLKKAALTAVAYHLNNNDLMKLGDAFEYFDKHNDGIISFEEFRDALLMLRSRETYHNQADYSITTDEVKLRKLFDDIDFGENGYINYSEFVAACLARKEGLKHEYAELIFELIDRDHSGVISIEDLHLFFGNEISINEIEGVIKQTFGCQKKILTEQDLESIMNTKMISNNNTEALAMYHSQSEGVNPDQTYISVSSIFNKVSNDSQEGNGSPNHSTSSLESIKEEDVLERSKALSIADRLANRSFQSK